MPNRRVTIGQFLSPRFVKLDDETSIELPEVPGVAVVARRMPSGSGEVPHSSRLERRTPVGTAMSSCRLPGQSQQLTNRRRHRVTALATQGSIDADDDCFRITANR